MECIYRKKVYKISECNLLHEILNTFKHTKISNSHYYPILHLCMNKHKGREKFNNFQILLESVFSSNVIMGKIIKLIPKEDAVMR